MKIGCPKEIKAQEGRVGLTPAGVDALILADLGAFTLAGKYAPNCQPVSIPALPMRNMLLLAQKSCRWPRMSMMPLT